jgi:hypothetical protein
VLREGLTVIVLSSIEWLLGETFLPVHIVRMEFNLYRFPDNAFHMSGFLDQDTGIIKLDAVTQDNVVLCHGSLIWIVKLDVSMVLLGPGLDGTPTPTFTGDAVYIRCF